jgi:hypothetical protein
VIAFGITSDLTQDTFVEFLTFLKLESAFTPRVFVIDRWGTQITAIEQTFPSAVIIYCRKHIEANIRDTLGRTSVLRHFWPCMFGDISEELFLHVMEDEMNLYIGVNPKKANFIQELINCSNRWLPSAVRSSRAQATTQRVEGFFGHTKNLIQRQPRTLLEIAKSEKILATIALNKSRLENVPLVDEIIMSAEDHGKIGSFAASTIKREFNRLETISKDQLMKQDIQYPCCNVHWDFGLPCVHLLYERMVNEQIPLLTLEDIPPRWQLEEFCVNDATHKIGQVTDSSKNVSKKWKMPEILARIEKAMSIAERRKDVQEAFTVLEESLSKLPPFASVQKNSQSQSDENPLPSDLVINDPPRLGIAGRLDSQHAAKSSIGGHQKVKKAHHCTLCGKVGHHRQRCPLATLRK